MSDPNNPQPTQGGGAQNNVPPVPQMPQAPQSADAPTVAFPTSPVPPAPSGDAPTVAFGTTPQNTQQPYGSQPSQPSFGGGQQGGYGAPQQGQPSQAFGGYQQNNAGFSGGGGVPPYNPNGGGSGNGGGSDNKKLMWIIIAAVAALAIAGAAIWAFTAGPFANKGDDKPQGDPKPSTSQAPTDPDPTDEPSPEPTETKGGKEPKADSEAGAVKAFLEALAKGDGTTANKYLSDKVSDAFGSDAVVKASVKDAPITDIEVEESGGTVTATFMVGDEEVSLDYYVRKSGKNYKIESFAMPSVYLPDGLITAGVLVNGEKAEIKKSDTLNAFPIQYTLSTDSKYLVLEGETTFIPYDYTTSSLTNLDVVVSDEGNEAAKKTLTDALTACLAEKTLASTCGMDVPATLSGGETVQEGSVTRTFDSSTQSKLDKVEFNPDWDNPLLLSTYDYFSPDVTATCTDTSGTTGTCDIWTFGGSKNPKIDLSKDPITIVWE